MTTTELKFLKGAYGATTAITKSTGATGTGAIVFDTTSKQIYVGGVAFGGNITDVTFDANKLLTITKADASTITLDFSDTASATATMNVFSHINQVIGKDLNVTGKEAKLNYEGANYLNGYTEGTTAVAKVETLVDADLRLDALIKAINDEIAAMNGAATIASATDGVVTIKAGVAQTNGKIEQGTGTDITLAKVATTGKAEDVKTATVTGATYDTTADEVSDTWKTAVTTNALATTDDVETSVEKLDTKIAALADELIADEKVISGTFDAVKDALGAEDDLSMDFSDLSDTAAKATTNVHDAIKAVEAEITAANITIDGHKGAITTGNGLTDVATDGGSFAVKAKNGDYVKVDADGVQIDSTKVDSAYTTANTTNLATVNTVKTAVEGLDVTEEVQAVTYTAATTDAGAKLVFNGVEEEDGKIKAGDGTTELQFAKVATTGTAADVAVVDANNHYTATDVEGALKEIAERVDAQAGGMRYNGGISTATATVNASTNDIRPGDIYLATAAMTIGTTSVEAGDMIVYKGAKSDSAVALTAENCNIIEKESDLMVTADGTLTADAIMLGAGNKAVKASTTLTETTITTAQTRAASALQTVTGETAKNDSYLQVSVSEKTGEDGAKTQAITSSATIQSVETADDDNKGLAEASDVKKYVDTKVGTAIQSVDGSATEKAKTVAQGDNVHVKVTATTDANNNVTLDTVASIDMATVTTAGATTADGVATATDARNIAKAEAASAIDALAGTATSDDASVATVKVDTENGEVKDVTVTTISAGVTYTAATPAQGETPATDANLSATTATGAVTGADIAAVKSYVDAKSAEAAKVVDNAATITVNSADATTLATVGGQAITAKAALYWEEWS